MFLCKLEHFIAKGKNPSSKIQNRVSKFAAKFLYKIGYRSKSYLKIWSKYTNAFM